MNSEEIMFEETLMSQRPSALRIDLFDRMHHALVDASNPPSGVDESLVSQLSAICPAAMPTALMDKLASVVEPVPVAAEMPQPIYGSQFRPYAAAAAVALLGAAAAWFAPMGERTERIATSSDHHSGASDGSRMIPLERARHLIPASYSDALCEARDEGIVWKDDLPHRVVRIVYLDMTTQTNEFGEQLHIEKPCVEYILIPETTQ